ncbi:hypothetical protein SUGI_0691360 [Cryptomeria japonica]|nr:hypothetical protein SUGI_0691360 [Cryptomeria japonica]
MSLPVENANASVAGLSPNLFRVMRIVPDKQDYSFVEKVQLPEHEILRLCNKFMPASASACLGNPPRIRIDFDGLNQRPFSAVGMYGEKKMLIRILRMKGLLEESVVAQLEGGNFEAGLYIIVPLETTSPVVAFYWHEGEHFREASRKDVSCNFIRYLVELCDYVYICVEGSYDFHTLATSMASSRSKASRTRRVHVTSVKNSDNDVELLPGFNVRIDGWGFINSKTSSALSGNKDGMFNHNRILVFCEGYQRCSFMTVEPKEKEKFVWKVCELSPMKKDLKVLTTNSGPAIVPACGTRSMALYDKSRFKIGIYKFDESFRKVYATGVEVQLETYKGSKVIKWMHLIPRKMELLLVDDSNTVRVLEIHEKPMMKSKHISLPLQQPLSKACISADGFFFIVFRQSQSSSYLDVSLEGREIMLEVYVLGDLMNHLKTIKFISDESRTPDLDHLQVKINSFGPQSHLVLHSPDDAPGFFSSHLLKTVSAKEVVQQEVQNKVPDGEQGETEIGGPCPPLGYIYHIFDKFATTPALFPTDKKDITFNIVLDNSADPCNGEACIKYLEALVRKLRVAKDKDFSNTRVCFQAENIDKWAEKFESMVSDAAYYNTKMRIGTWIRKLLCLVPIQIARAENNGMVALKDGLQIPSHVSYVDSISLANLMRFGFYDAVINSWRGKIRVISSMGKQSSGKSYLLNHLSGSLLDVSGGRCTDGVWMTITTGEGDGCLYVLLDFEGLGSFERSEQEDMLLSVLNAALSNLTIFNKKDFHLDKDTESAFSRFQSGINLLEQDKKLFKGLFYIAIKDVDESDVVDLIQEFHEKISQICSKSQENFILKMYDGKFEIAAMAPYNRAEYYHDSLRELAQTVYETDSCYDNGSIFLKDLKLIIAQIAVKDWSSVDSKRVAIIVDIVRRNLMCAINMGCLSPTNSDEVQELVNFDTQVEVPDMPLVVGESVLINIRDSGLSLAPSKESSTSSSIRDLLAQLRLKLEAVLPRKGSNIDSWHSMLERFLSAVAERRRDRVQRWISSNTVDFSGNDEVERLVLEADVILGKIKQGLSVCGCKCSQCFWRCVLEKGHDDDHSCMSTHSCTEHCSYCVKEWGEREEVETLSLCRDLAGHEGGHNCREKNHTCGQTCDLFERSSNCNKLCSLEPEHHGNQHKCNSPQHKCKMPCSLQSCNNPCAVAVELDHEQHQCHETYCPSPCVMNGCSRTCGVKDHFHGMNDPNVEHLCGSEHACAEKCEEPGICEILTELVRQTRVFEGQRGCFQYEHVSEQNGLRKGCCIPIPPFEKKHRGAHVHTKNELSVHYCDTRCQACGYFCRRPVGHLGLHETTHGNMRNVRFISEEEDIDIKDRKYKWGEKGEAEMCNMYCRKQGRGHIHLVPCKGFEICASNLYDGARHETVKYGPDVDVPKDEMTHETYWEYVRFVDPCTKEEGIEFGLCNHYCQSEEHNSEEKASKNSYCTENLWHEPISKTGQRMNSAGYVTDDGHHFSCDHSNNVPYHVVFVIDKSGSMSCSDISPTMAKFNNHDCRLGCVYEAILRFIQARLRTVCEDSISVVLFDTSARVAVGIQDMEEVVVDLLLQYRASGGTTYSSGLDAAQKLMMKATRDLKEDMKTPVVIFLSDGENNGGEDPVSFVNRMKRQEPKMTLHTIMYGQNPAMSILEEMAKEGQGQFQLTLDGLQLAQSFENLAKSLKPRVAALM